MKVRDARDVLMSIRHELDGKIEDKVIHQLDEVIEGLESNDLDQAKWLYRLDLILRTIPSVQRLLEQVQQYLE